MHPTHAFLLGAVALMTSVPTLSETVAAPPTAAQAALAGNPLIGAWNTPDGAPPYDRIKPEHYEPAVDEGIREALQQARMIGMQRSMPTFENTVERLEQSGELLSRTLNTFFNLTGSDGTPEIQKAEAAIAPKLARFQSDLYLDKALFTRIDQIYRQRDTLKLEPEQARLLAVTHQNFVRAGAALPEEGKKRLAAIDEEMAGLSVQFSTNVLADQKAGDTFLSEAEMAGMPADFVAAAAARAKQAGKPGQYLVAATRSEFEPFMTLASNRDARAKVFKAFDERGMRGNANDNRALITRMLRLRLEKANLLEYKSWADYQLEQSMAKTPDAASALLKQVIDAGLARAAQEERDLLELAKADGVTKLAAWDWRYYSEKLRQQRYAFDETQLKQYLPLEGIREGLWYTTNRLYGVTVKERSDIPVWTAGVKTFDMFDKDGTRLGLFYGDWFARPTKQPGAWMNEIRTQDGMRKLTPQVVNNTNYNVPAAGQPALLSFDDANTMFHEFGHATHGLFSRTHYPTLAGTNVYRDFVEFPSQFYEHWMSSREVLQQFARNAKGEPMPPALLDSLLKARNFNQGYLTVQQLASAVVDMDIHRLEKLPADFDPVAFEKATLAKYGVPDAVGMRHRLGHFTHLFSGGYSAGYYAYTWAEVLKADAFAKFEESGDIWNTALAQSYRDNILSRGNSRDPRDSYIAFRGRMPTADALLKERGLK